MITLSSGAIESMGFRRFGPDHKIRASFSSAIVYQARGIALDPGSVSILSGTIQNARYRAALGPDLSEVSCALLGDNYTDDVATWQKEHRCRPPYLIVVVGPTEIHECADGYVRDDGDALSTFDGFADARSEVNRLEGRVIPRLLSALAATFGLRQPPGKFVKVDRIWFGVTSDRRVIHDLRIGGSASGYVSACISGDDAKNMLDEAGVLSARLNKKVAQFFHLGIEETDPLKRFLYLFLSIEITTHTTFSSIDHAAQLALLLASPARLKGSLLGLLASQQNRWTALRDRFVWCALCVWTQLDDADVAAFGQLKKVRDSIAHGTLAVPPADAIASAQGLAMRIHSGGRRADA